jgi:hypothetical protein
MRMPKFLAASAIFWLFFLPSAVAAAGPVVPEPHTGRVFHLLDQAWCVGDVNDATYCDVRIGGREKQIVHTSDPLPRPTFHDALDRLRLLSRPEPLTPLDKELRLHELLGSGGNGVLRR